MRIVILGGLGNYGLALAGFISRNGHEVFILQFPETVQVIPNMPLKSYDPLIRKFETNERKFQITDYSSQEILYFQLPYKTLRDVNEIPEDVDIVIVAYPSLLHEMIGKLLREFLKNKIVITFTDRFLGGYSLLKQANLWHDAKLIAFSATPFTTTKDLNNVFNRIIFHNKYQIRVAIMPLIESDSLVEILNSILSCDIKLNSILELAFNCTPSNLHAPHDLLNIIRYEQSHKFKMYHEGFTQGVENVINAVSDERCKIARAFNVNAISFIEYEQQTYNYKGNSILENRRGNLQLNQIYAPMSLYACKGIEDVMCSLVPLSEFAKLAGIAAPTINSLIHIWSCYLDINLREFGRTLLKLGLINKSIQEIQSELQ